MNIPAKTIDTNYRRLFDAGPNALLVLTPDLWIVAVTDKYLAMAMLERDEIIGQRFFDVFPKDVLDPTRDSSPRLRASLDRVSATHTVHELPVQAHQVSCDSAPGRVQRRYARVVNSPVLGADGTLEYIIQSLENVAMGRPEGHGNDREAAATDHSECERRISAYEQHAAALGEKLRSAEIATAILAHDLKSPMTALKLSVQSLLHGGGLPAAGRGVLELADRTVSRLSRMVTQLLDLTRARVSGMPIEPRAVDLGRVCADVIEEIRAVFPGRVIAFDCDRQLTGSVDPDRLAQAVSNLVTNAVQHSPATAPVEVVAHAHGAAIELAVTNDAVIPSDQMGRLFVPFGRVSGKRGTAASPGLGLGLYIAREIAHAHRGTLTACSTAESGTTFTLRLPRAELGMRTV